MMNSSWDRWVEVKDALADVYAAPALRVGKPSQATQISKSFLYAEYRPTGRGRKD